MVSISVMVRVRAAEILQWRRVSREPAAARAPAPRPEPEPEPARTLSLPRAGAALHSLQSESEMPSSSSRQGLPYTPSSNMFQQQLKRKVARHVARSK